MRRLWRSLKTWLGLYNPHIGPRFLIHQRYQLDLPFPQYDARRPFRILTYLEMRRLLRKGMLRRPRPVSVKKLQMVHDPAYLASLEAPGALEPILGLRLEGRQRDLFLAFQRMMCGGTLHAARYAFYQRGIAVNLGGGFHHAARGCGSGFCAFNDIAVAVAAMRARGHRPRILVVDLDLHDGDGTREIFAADETVHTYSLHNQDLGSTEAIESTSIALGGDVGDRTYLQTLRQTLPAVVENFAPELVFYLAGSDPGVDDKLGDWRITLEGMLTRDRFVMDTLAAAGGAVGPAASYPYDAVPGRRIGLPCVVLLAGGYGPRSWRHGAAFFSWLLSGDSHLDIPLELELPVGHYRHLARLMKNPGLRHDERGGKRSHRGEEDDWGLSTAEFDGMGRPSRSNLFMGLFSRFGLELALEESGVLERLRGMGFKGVKVKIDPPDPLGHTMRILTNDPDPLVLLEIRLRVDQTCEPGCTFLSVEWLLLQDSRSRLDMDRPLLPGQSHPGLGLLRDTAAVLVVLCERLELDGLSFTPSHYHLAAMARPMAMATDPEAEGRFQAVSRAVAHLRLLEATAVVETGGLVDEKTGRHYEWRPAHLVIPVSGQLRERFESAAYRDRVASVRDSHDFRIDDSRNPT